VILHVSVLRLHHCDVTISTCNSDDTVLVMIVTVVTAVMAGNISNAGNITAVTSITIITSTVSSLLHNNVMY